MGTIIVWLTQGNTTSTCSWEITVRSTYYIKSSNYILYQLSLILNTVYKFHIWSDVHVYTSAVTGHAPTGSGVPPHCTSVSLCMCSCLLDGPVDTSDCCLCCCQMQVLFSVPSSPSVFIATTAFLVALWVATVTVFGVVTAVLCSKIHKLKQIGNPTIM